MNVFTQRHQPSHEDAGNHFYPIHNTHFTAQSSVLRTNLRSGTVFQHSTNSYTAHQKQTIKLRKPSRSTDTRRSSNSLFVVDDGSCGWLICGRRSTFCRGLRSQKIVFVLDDVLALSGRVCTAAHFHRFCSTRNFLTAVVVFACFCCLMKWKRPRFFSTGRYMTSPVMTLFTHARQNNR